MDATIRFAVGCWGVVIGFWIVTAFSVKRTRAQQPLRHRLLYLVLTAVAAPLLNGSVPIIRWNRAVLPHTFPTGILGDFLVLIGLFIALWARVTVGGNWNAQELQGRPKSDPQKVRIAARLGRNQSVEPGSAGCVDRDRVVGAADGDAAGHGRPGGR